MTGRILFALVWVIIVTGVALPLFPLFPRDLATATVAVTTDPVQLAAGTDAFGCEDCPVDDTGRADCPSDCPCGPAQPALFVPLEQPVSLAVRITVRPFNPPAAPQLLPSILPAI
jgi:hypothetical protein